MHPVLSAALKAMRAVDSFHFVESFSNNSGVCGALSGIDYEVMFEAIGEYQSPDRLRRRVIIHGVSYPTESDIQAINIGDARYLTDPDTGEWGRPADSPCAPDLFANPIELFEGVAAFLGPGAYQGVIRSDGIEGHRFWYRTPDHAFEAKVLVSVDRPLVKELSTESRWGERRCRPGQKCPAILIIPGWERRMVQFSYPDEGVTIEAPQIRTP